MKIGAGKSIKEPQKRSRIGSLINDLKYKIRSDKGKEFFINHLIPFLIFLCLSIIIYRNIIGVEGEFINADLVRPPELDRFYELFTPMWRENESVTTMSRLPGLLFYLPFFGLGFLVNSGTSEVLVLIFLIIETLAGISMYYTSRYFLKKTYVNIDNSKVIFAAFTAGLAYMWHGYMIYHALHPLIRMAYAFAPLIVLFLIKGLEEKKIKYIILSAFLWSVVCADVHWVVYGAILTFSIILFYLILNYIQSAPEGRLKALKGSLKVNLKGFIALIISFIGFSCYWLIPGMLMGGTNRYGYVLTIESLEDYYARADIVQMIQKQGEHPLTREMFAVPELLDNPVIQNIIILFSFGVFIFGMLALILKPKNRYVIFFTGFTLLALVLSTFANSSAEWGYWIVSEAPLHEFYGWAFRSPKIAQFIILGLSILIGFTVIEMLLRAEKIKNININFRKSAVIAIISILFISIILPNWPLATGDLNGRLTPTIMPDEFGDANSWLEDQPGDFKVIWMPKYNSQDVEWNSEHRTILDIASMSSSKPTYVFNNPHMQPNRYGIYSLSSIFGSYDHSIIVSNSTNELGKLLAPLGIKYILFHDDNATKPFMQNELLKNLLYQNDLKLVQKFGFIYIFENIHEFDHDASKIFATSNNNLILGGMETLATLNSIPDFDQRANGAFFSGQKSHDSDELNEYIDTIILTRSSELEDLALKYADEDYFIAPFDQCEHYAPWETWSKARTMDRNWLMTSRKSNLKAWDWEYDRGVVFTWATGTVQSESAFLNEDLIKFYNFETGLNNFTELTSNIDIYQSKYSTQGDWSLKGSIDKGRYINNQGAGSGFIPIPIDNRNLRFSLNLAAENAVNVQVRIKYYDEDQNYLGRDFVLTETGSFEFTKYEKDVTLADNVAYCSIQILADENPATNSYWWIDELKIFDLNNLIDPNALDIEFDIEKNNNYDIFIRILKGDTGGKVNLVIDDELVNSLETKSKNFGFSWECIESIYFEKGSHEVSIENDAGFNAVNLIAIIPIEKTEEYFENAEEFVENKDIIYLMEAENNFVFSNAKILMQYGSLASSGEVISFGENGSARLPLEILQSGNYTLALRLAKGRDSSNLNFTFANKTYRIRNTNNNDLEWIEFHDIYVENGTNEIKFESTPIQIFNLNLSFEYGWNDEKDAPVNWYAPRTEFSVGLDPRFKTDGNYSVRLTTDSQSSEILSHLKSRDIKIKPGIYYNISLDVKLDNIINTRVKIAGYNKTAQEWVYIDNIVAGLKGTKNWQTYFKRIFIPINISKINIIINAGTVSNPSRGNATAWFDAIQIQRLVEAKNIDLDLISLFLDVNNQSVQEHFTPKSEAAVLNYKKIDSTRYEVEIRSTAPFILVFAETFDEFWVAQGSGMDKIESVPVYGMLNGFYIEKTGNFSIIIEYEPQQWFNIGASITGISIAGSIGYFIWVDRKKWGDRFNKLIKRNEKIVKK